MILLLRIDTGVTDTSCPVAATSVLGVVTRAASLAPPTSTDKPTPRQNTASWFHFSWVESLLAQSLPAAHERQLILLTSSFQELNSGFEIPQPHNKHCLIVMLESLPLDRILEQTALHSGIVILLQTCQGISSCKPVLSSELGKPHHDMRPLNPSDPTLPPRYHGREPVGRNQKRKHSW